MQSNQAQVPSEPKKLFKVASNLPLCASVPFPASRTENFSLQALQAT